MPQPQQRHTHPHLKQVPPSASSSEGVCWRLTRSSKRLFLAVPYLAETYYLCTTAAEARARHPGERERWYIDRLDEEWEPTGMADALPRCVRIIGQVAAVFHYIYVCICEAESTRAKLEGCALLVLWLLFLFFSAFFSDYHVCI